MVFNANRFFNSHKYTCTVCEQSYPYKVATSGCPHCGNSFFHVANRGTGYPNIWERDRDDQKKRRGPFSNTDGEGYDLTRKDDEDWQGSGMGGRARGKLFPTDFSSDSEEYEEQRKKDIPGSLDDGEINVPGDIAADRSYQISGEFADPIDPLSRSQQMSRDLNSKKMPTLENQLGRSRVDKSQDIKRTDSIYDRIALKQKGNRR